MQLLYSVKPVPGLQYLCRAGVARYSEGRTGHPVGADQCGQVCFGLGQFLPVLFLGALGGSQFTLQNTFLGVPAS